MVDMATSPLFPYEEDSNFSASGTVSPDPSCIYGSTFLTDRYISLNVKDLAEGVASLNVKENSVGDVTSRQPKDVEEMRSPHVKNIRVIPEVKIVRRVVKDKPKRTIVEPIARSMSFSERPLRRSPLRRYRDLTKLSLVPPATTSSLGRGQEPIQNLPTDRFQPQPDTARSSTRLESPRKRRSSSVSDLTEIGSIFSWHDKEFERKTIQSVDIDSDSIGPTSFFQMKKSKSLWDLLKPCRINNPERKASDLSAFYHNQRLSHLASRRGNSFRRNSSLDWEEADRGWKDIVNTQVIDDKDYERFASRRKPATLSTKKHPRATSPRGSRELRYSHADNGKLYPMFVNGGAQAKKVGRALHHSRKLLKSK